MSITSNTANVQILTDTASRLQAKFIYYSASGTNESDVLKINVETLACRTFELTVVDTANATFQPGDILIGQTSNARATVSSWRLSDNVVTVVGISGNTAFGGTEVVVNDRTQKSTTLSSVATPERRLDIESVWYSIAPNMAVELGFGNSTPSVVASLLLSGNGYYGKNQFGVTVPNDQITPSGNFYISTYLTSADTLYAYTIVVDFRKSRGFSQTPLG